MKKMKIFLKAILRTLGIFAPAVAFGWWFRGAVPDLFLILASVGVGAIWSFLVVLVLSVIQYHQDARRTRRSA